MPHAGRHDVRQQLRVSGRVASQRRPRRPAIGAPGQQRLRGRLADARAVAIGRRSAGERQERAGGLERALAVARFQEGGAEVILRRALHARVGGRPLERQAARVPVEHGELTEQGRVVEVDDLGRPQHFGRARRLEVCLLEKRERPGRQARPRVHADELLPHERRRPRADVLQHGVGERHRSRLRDPGPAVDRRQRGLCLRVPRLEGVPERARRRGILAKEMREAEVRHGLRPEAGLDAGLGGEALQDLDGVRGPSALEQRLTEVQARQAAGAGPANGGDGPQILQLDRCGGLRELSVELGGTEIHDAKGERGGRLPARVQRGQRRLQGAGGVPVMTLVVELHRARHGVVRRPRRRRREHRERHQQRGTPAGRHQSFSLATKIWSH